LMGSFERYADAVDRAVGDLSGGSAAPALGGANEADELPAETVERSGGWR